MTMFTMKSQDIQNSQAKKTDNASSHRLARVILQFQNIQHTRGMNSILTASVELKFSCRMHSRKCG